MGQGSLGIRIGILLTVERYELPPRLWGQASMVMQPERLQNNMSVQHRV